ncbi:hypothetical protein CHLRE_15g640204v5 [Chlamydomonas reinhardtii]|uniref:Uncharacterized protein n=1 Tax=Chlamydomonas reinhardtii TaxID=3055 RepID=A0A2K3CWM3_CHLRE|nr:uncharacterized protein CHLRE_15g640204v5 [Chlamydomonas reinhardtii]PNW72687.1 hypothetical protein CHLRE_15g640204v5 [Chlamydomonas reinhardtii]
MPAGLAPFPAAGWCQARRAWSWLQLLWHRNQVKARRARALSRGWMVSSPQGMELATVAMASQSA